VTIHGQVSTGLIKTIHSVDWTFTDNMADPARQYVALSLFDLPVWKFQEQWLEQFTWMPNSGHLAQKTTPHAESRTYE
jgi:hypothetical protein